MGCCRHNKKFLQTLQGAGYSEQHGGAILATIASGAATILIQQAIATIAVAAIKFAAVLYKARDMTEQQKKRLLQLYVDSELTKEKLIDNTLKQAALKVIVAGASSAASSAAKATVSAVGKHVIGPLADKTTEAAAAVGSKITDAGRQLIRGSVTGVDPIQMSEIDEMDDTEI